ncbi:MAG: glycoside hydrolase family 88 protein [Verrucomicrobiota bacterium]
MKPFRNVYAPNLFGASLLGAFLAALLAGCANAQPKPDQHFSNWPAGTAPAEVGKRVAENFLPRKFRYETNPEKASIGIIYPEVIAWYGSLTLAQLTGDTNLTARLIQKFEPLLSEPGSKRINRSSHVDFRVFGIVPLEIYLQAKDERCLKLGLSLADAQWGKTTPDGISTEARYWIDDMYMMPAVQVQAFRATGEAKYLDRAALAMTAYFDRLQQTNGLFFHGTNAPFYWGRGNGWMAAGSAELLRSLPENHPQRAHILAGYRKMMTALLATQDKDGLWHQLLDKPGSWPETSGSAMFAFAFVTGVKSGWLEEKTYGPAARRGWLALVKQVDAEGNLREVCVGTNKGDSEKFYNDRPRAVGDLHGQAPMLWTASALLR